MCTPHHARVAEEAMMGGMGDPASSKSETRVSEPWFAPLLEMRERNRRSRAKAVVVHFPCGCLHVYGGEDLLYRGGPPCRNPECPNQFEKRWGEILKIREEDVRTGRPGLVAHRRGDRCEEGHCHAEAEGWAKRERAWKAEERLWRVGTV
jgi:hypothetical protein